MAGRLGELLVRENLISLQQLQKAQDEQKKAGGRIGYHLTKLGFIEESELTNFLSKQYGVPSISLKEFDIDAEVVRLVPKDVAEKHQCIPVNRAGASLILAMSDPSNIYAIDDIKFLTGYNVEVVVASEQAIKEALEKYYAEKGPSYDEVMEGFDESEIGVEHDEAGVTDINDLEKSAADAPVVKLVNLILLDAIKKGASDIHVEPCEKDFRVSVCPTLFGEKVVLRLLDKSNLQLDMTKLGFDPEPLKAFKENIDRPYEMVLVTGPTGSGKTTTLYSALAELNKTTDNISTAEDPVEFNFAGINQVQMHEDIGLNFAAALRSFLRQGPDIIMVGEIRDFETAEIGIKAALTGHLVLSTLRTNDAPGTVSRLLNMGIEPFLVTSAVNLILAQRLARKLCQECKKLVQVAPQALTDIGVQPDEIGTFEVFEPAGCRTCNDRGYKGRVALYEVMPLWDSVKELVINGASTLELKAEAIRLGMQTLRMAGLAKLKTGMTSIEEVVGNTAPDSMR